MPRLHECSLSVRGQGVRARAGTALVASCLALAGCNKKDDAATTADGKTADGKTADAKGDKATGPAGGTNTGTGTNPADAPLSPATQIQRGSVLGHIALPNGSTLISEVQTQIVPAAQAAMVNEQMLRTLAGGALADRGKIATNLDLTKPMGCALVDSTVTNVPLACVVGYTGGAAALAADLGNEGKAADPAGHVAKFSLGGEELFIDDLGGSAVVTNHAELFAKSKDYLDANIVARASSLASDIEIVVFPSAAMTRYEPLLAPVLEQLKKVQAAPGGDNPFAKAFQDYSTKSNDRILKVLKEMDQFTMALSIEPVGFVLRTATFPIPGSDLEKESKLAAAGALDAKLLEELPNSSFFVSGYASNLHKVADSPTFMELKASMVRAYAEAVGKDAATVSAAIDAFIAENDTIYGDHSAGALIHEPGTLGGFVGLTALEPGQSGRDSWKAWSAVFTPEAVLGAEGASKVTWSFQADAATIGGVPVDRWTIEPTEATKAQIRKEGGEELAKWEPRLGGLKLVVNRIELDGKAAFIVAPGSDDKSVQAVIDSVNGTNGLAGDPGLTAVVSRNPGVSGIFAVNVKRAADWIKEFLPADKAAQIPADLGGGLDDVFFATSYAATGSASGEVVASQRFIDQIRALAK